MSKRVKRRRAVAVLVCVAGVVGALAATAVAQSQRFPDVPPDHYAFEAVEWAAEVGVTTGYTDGTFKPQRPLSKRHAVVFMERYYDEILQADESEDFTRGDMMVLLKAINDGTLRRADTGTGDDMPDDQSPAAAASAQGQRFPDVSPDHYAFAAVEWAAEVGVTTGYTDGTFKPQRPLSKRHAVVFMERYYDEILQADESGDFTRGDMMVLLKAINDGTLRDTGTGAFNGSGMEDFVDLFNAMDSEPCLAPLQAVGAGLVSTSENDSVPDDSLALLVPGYNFVGWIAETIEVEDLFEAIPQVEVICFWDAAERQVRFAAPMLPSASWTLRAIEPGMAVLVWNGSEQSVPWITQTQLAQGLVELRRGMNWVSWAGPSGWSIDDVARGIGRSVVRIKVGEQNYSPSHPSSGLLSAEVLRGDPMIVEVARDVRWLQPTGMLPEISFFGDFTDSQQRHHIDMVEEVVDFYEKNYGVEADATTLEIWIYDPESALDDTQLSSRQRQIISRNIERNVVTGSATEIAITRGYGKSAQSIMVHEYFHSLQAQLAGHNFAAPTWIVEGQAVWMEFRFDFTGNINGWEYYVNEESGRCRHATLLAGRTFGCEYVLGILAAKLLEETAGSESIVEFWRQLAPNWIGPKNRWESLVDWSEAFARAFGLSPSDFDARYSAQRNTSTSGTNGDSRPTSRTVYVEGYVQDDKGVAAPGVIVALEQSSGVYSGYRSHTITDAEGRFMLEVFVGEKHRVRIGGGCGYWIGESGTTLSRHLGKEFTLESPGSPLHLQMSSEYCVRRIEGTVVSPPFGPLEGVRAIVDGDGWSQTQRTSSEGRFTFSVHSEGDYSIVVELSRGCRVWYRRGGAAGPWSEATTVLVSDSDITDILLQVPSDACLPHMSE